MLRYVKRPDFTLEMAGIRARIWASGTGIPHRFRTMTFCETLTDLALDVASARSLSPVRSEILGRLEEDPIGQALAAPVGDAWRAACDARCFAAYINQREGGRVVNEIDTFLALTFLRPWNRTSPMFVPWRQVRSWIALNLR